MVKIINAITSCPHGGVGGSEEERIETLIRVDCTVSRMYCTPSSIFSRRRLDSVHK